MSYQIELRQIKYFLAVAEDLHFRKAAERLFISQPGLSKQIKSMENGLGIRLFERHNRKVELTQAGLYLKEEFARYFKSLDYVLQHAKQLNDGLSGELRFGYVGSAMQQVIPELLLAFRKKYPRILFSLKEMDNQSQIDSLLSHDIDIGFVRLDRIPRGLEAWTVINECFCLVLPASHPINDQNFKDLSQLKEASFILFDPRYSPSYYQKVMQIFSDHNFSPIVSHNTIHAGSIYKLVENNFGVSLVPKSLRSPHWSGVKFVELNNIPQRTELSAIWNSNNRNPILDHVLELIKSN